MRSGSSKQVVQHLEEQFGLPLTVILGHRIPSQGAVPLPSSSTGSVGRP